MDFETDRDAEVGAGRWHSTAIYHFIFTISTFALLVELSSLTIIEIYPMNHIANINRPISIS